MHQCSHIQLRAHYTFLQILPTIKILFLAKTQSTREDMGGINDRTPLNTRIPDPFFATARAPDTFRI